jgi:AcrR family transcriptional regulator
MVLSKPKTYVAKTYVATGRPRDDAACQSILWATASLLEEVGFDKLSIEGIAARAGVAKTTIYRWWRNKGILALEAFLTAVSPKIAFTETADPLDDLRAQVQKVGKLYRGKTGRILCELIALAQADAETHRQLLEGYLTPRRTIAKACLQRAIAQGALRSDTDLDIMIDAIYAPLWYRMMLQDAPLDAASIDTLLDLTFYGMAATSRR